MRLSLSNLQFSGLGGVAPGIQAIELHEPPVGEGGFGAVYRVRSIDGQVPTEALVAKLFLDVPHAVACLDNVQRLQRAIQVHLTNAGIPGIGLRQQKPGLTAFPLVSFTTTHNGKARSGYLAADLNVAGFTDFDHILEQPQLKASFDALSPADRLSLGLQLIDTFELLRQLNYIHADLKPDALFIDLKSKRLALIDLDSGALMTAAGDKPTTWGTKQSWLAPEVRQQVTLGERQAGVGNPVRVKVDLNADVWAVNCGLHNLLYGFDPYAGLTEITERSLLPLSTASTYSPLPPAYPFAAPAGASIDGTLAAINTRYSAEIASAFQNSFTRGIKNANSRTSYAQWRLLLQSIASPPKIQRFSVDRQYVDSKVSIQIDWQVESAVQVLLNGHLVSTSGSQQITIRRPTALTLTALSPFGKTEQTIHLTVATVQPTIHKFESDLLNQTLHEAKKFWLAWQVEDAEEISLHPHTGTLGRNGVWLHPIRQATRYTLTATSYFGQITTRELLISVDQRPPTIYSFEADTQLRLSAATPVMLSWSTVDAEQVALEAVSSAGSLPLPGPIALHGTLVVDHRRAVEYRLTATSFFGVVSRRSLRVEVSQRRPDIAYFRASVAFISGPTEVTIVWQVSGAEQIELRRPAVAPIALQPLGTEVIVLEKAAPITLVATSEFGVEAISEIRFHAPVHDPIVSSFRAEPSPNQTGQGSVRLYWSVEGASEVIIAPSLGRVNSRGEIEVYPLAPTTYTLTASTARGRSTRRELLVIPVDRAPIIRSFLASPPFIRTGEPIELTWEVEGATQVFIDPLGPQPAHGSINLGAVHQSNQYTLTAYNALGTVTRRSISIRTLSTRFAIAPPHFFSRP